jgi:hypothetical protein
MHFLPIDWQEHQTSTAAGGVELSLYILYELIVDLLDEFQAKQRARRLNL